MFQHTQNAYSEAITQSRRNVGLDQLRGSLAFTIMIYHLIHWQGVKGEGLFYRILDMAGLYFVSSFYILSGIALMIAYGRTPLSRLKLADFLVKRFFRIMPLFWLVTGVAIIHMQTGVIPVPANFNKTNFLLSVTGLFSWIQPRAYFSAGMWSIGNELAFYSLFPAFIYLLKFRNMFFVSAIAGIVSSFIWANNILAGHIGTSYQWNSYIHPINQLCFFSSGLMIGWSLNEHHLSTSRLKHATLLLLGVVLFCIVSIIISRDQALVGPPKMMMLLICTMMCVGATGWVSTGYAGGFLEWLGKISYSLYLLHWPVYLWVNKFLLFDKDVYLVIYTSVLLSLILSTLSYMFIESPFVHVGKRFSRLVCRLIPSRA